MSLNCYAEETYTAYSIKERGKRVDVSIKTTSAKSTQKTKQGKTFDENVMIVIKFNQAVEVDIDAFLSRYDLELERQMITGHYLLHNHSKHKPMALIQTIIDNEPAVDSIFPNWRLNNKQN
jgi:hypothetical protein